MRHFFLIFTISCLLTLTGCVQFKVKSVRDEKVNETSVKKTNLIEIKNGSFTPDKIQLNLGESVFITNRDKTPYIIASDPHETHSDLPDFYSNEIFKDETYSYTFTKEGYFGFHIEQNPSIRGLIVVISPKE